LRSALLAKLAALSQNARHFSQNSQPPTPLEQPWKSGASAPRQPWKSGASAVEERRFSAASAREFRGL